MIEYKLYRQSQTLRSDQGDHRRTVFIVERWEDGGIDPQRGSLADMEAYLDAQTGPGEAEAVARARAAGWVDVR